MTTATAAAKSPNLRRNKLAVSWRRRPAENESWGDKDEQSPREPQVFLLARRGENFPLARAKLFPNTRDPKQARAWATNRSTRKLALRLLACGHPQLSPGRRQQVRSGAQSRARWALIRVEPQNFGEPARGATCLAAPRSGLCHLFASSLAGAPSGKPRNGLLLSPARSRPRTSLAEANKISAALDPGEQAKRNYSRQLVGWALQGKPRTTYLIESAANIGPANERRAE